MMLQSKLESLIEAVFNTIIGFVVSFAAWPICGWLFDLEYTSDQHVQVIAFFTVLSVARGYIVRRWFNHRIKLAAITAAQLIKE